MRVLVVDPLSFSGHINYNYGIIDAISENYEYDVICNENHFESLKDKGISSERFVKVYPNKWNIAALAKEYNKLLYHLLYRFFFLRVILFTLFLKKNYDFIFFTSIVIDSFWWISWLFNEKCVIVDHGIGSITNNRHYRLSWKLCNSRIKIIVLEDFIRDMVTAVLPSKPVCVVRHPLPCQDIYQSTSRSDKICLFAPSNSNEEAFLRNLSSMKIPENIFILAKSRTFEHDSSNINITNRFISNEEYNTMLNDSEFILLPYESSYNYRISAVLFEALVLNKKILLLDNNTLSCYKKYFPHNIILFNQNDSLVDIIKEKANFKLTDIPNLKSYKKDALASQISSFIG